MIFSVTSLLSAAEKVRQCRGTWGSNFPIRCCQVHHPHLMEMLGEGRPPPRSPPSRRPASLLVLHSVWKLSEGVWKQGFCLSFSVFADSMHKQLAPLLNSRQEGLSKCTGICRLIYTERTESRGRKQILPCIFNSLPGLAEAKHQNILTHSCFGKYFNIQSFYLYLIYQLTSNFWNTPGWPLYNLQCH